MKKIISWVLTLAVMTGCTPAVSKQPVVNYVPANTSVPGPVVVNGTVYVSPSKFLFPPPVVTPATNPIIVAGNATINIQTSPPPAVTNPIVPPQPPAAITPNTTANTTNPIQPPPPPAADPVTPNITVPINPPPQATANVAEAMVQVWSVNSSGNGAKKLQSFGLGVGDGSQVLTYFDYESYTPDGIEILTQNQTRYTAYVKAIDPRTGLTLLKLNTADKIPFAALNATAVPQSGQQVRVWGWRGPDYSNIESSNPTAVIGGQGPFYFTFQGVFSADRPVIFKGAVVTDSANNVIGIETERYNTLITHLGFGIFISVALINSGVELLSQGSVNRSFAGGPVISTVANSTGWSGYSGGILTTTEKYESMTAAVQSIFLTLGDNTTTADLPYGFGALNLARPFEGTLLFLVYPTPIELKSSNGTVLAKAKWIAIQWGRSERPTEPAAFRKYSLRHGRRFRYTGKRYRFAAGDTIMN